MAKRPQKKKSQERNRTQPTPPLPFLDEEFLTSTDARSLRILAEYLEPAARFKAEGVQDTIVFFGSARIKPRDEAEKEVVAAQAARHGIGAARQRLRMSRYYDDARELARRLTEWSKALSDDKRFIICTGGGPGIMEAANRGAADAKGLNIGLNIALPFEQSCNGYSTRSLTFQFHYFFMRKFWFAYFAKAMVFMPGGLGTMDEMMEVLTLCQTLKLKQRMPMVLYGTDFWRGVLDFNALVKAGTISREDLDLVHRTDNVDEAFDFITSELKAHALARPGGTLEHWHNLVDEPPVSGRDPARH
ncbi:MAG: LOG family protein [Alphaproteobacteria bacterium]|nr:LOG family protein [Alphaproteobacteria bacterium]